jgi:hypothetical protein
MGRRHALIAAAALLVALAPLGSAQATTSPTTRASLPAGRYAIISADAAVGHLTFAKHTLPIYPAVYFIVGSRAGKPEPWSITPAANGSSTITSTTHPNARWTQRGDTIVAAQGAHDTFAISPAGENEFVIHVPDTDEVATIDDSDGERLHTAPANGSVGQRWRLVRVAA